MSQLRVVRGGLSRLLSRAGRSSAIADGPILEHCEARTLLDAVAWDGGAGTSNWHDAANWNRNGVDAVPVNGDDVTINVAANPTITFSTGTLTLNSLTTAEALTVTGGTLGLTGAADINAALTLSGGTLSGGAWDVTGGALRTTSSGGFLTNTNITGDVLLDTSSANVRVTGTTRFSAVRLSVGNTNLQFAPGYTLHDLVVAEGATAGGRTITGAVGGSGTLTISPTGVIRLAASSGGNLSISNSSVLTLVNNGLISAEAAGRNLTINNSTLTNNSTMQASAGLLTISPTDLTTSGTITANNAELSINGVWSNSGSITATNSTLNLAGTWPSGGTINATNTTVNLGGAFNATGLAGFTRTGGIVNLTGTMTNTGNTFTFNAATGSWNFSGGTIIGGTVAFTSERLVHTGSVGIYTDVQINGELLADTSNASVRVTGTTRFTAVCLSGSNTSIQFAPNYTLRDLVVAEGAAAGSRSITGAVGGTGDLTIAPTGVIRLAPGTGGNLSISNSNVLTLINNGLISAEAAGRTLNINNSNVTNNTTIQVTAGSLNISPTNLTNNAAITSSNAELTISAVWTNTGTITATNSTLTLGGTWPSAGTITATNSVVNFGGAFNATGLAGFTRTGGTVNLTGTMTNTGNTFTFNAATGSWNLVGGTVTGGTLVFAASRLIPASNSGFLTDVLVDGDLLLDVANSSVRISGTTRFDALRLAGSNTGAQFAPGYTLFDTVTAEGAAAGGRSITGAVGGTGTLTISPTGVIRLAAGAGGNLTISNSNVLTLINNGLISAEAPDRTLTINNSILTNNAAMQVSAGTLNISPTNWTTAGTITATNAILTLEGAWVNTGTITSTNATVNLAGTFATTSVGTYARTGGTVNLTGDMNNNAAAFAFNAATGSWNFLGGTITDGTISFSGANRLVPTTSGGLLTDVQINGDILFDTTSSRVRVAGATRFTAARLAANGANLDFVPGYTLHDLVVAEGAAIGTRSIQGAVGGTGTLTISPTGVIRLAAGSGGGLSISNSNALTLVNNGLISAEAPDRTLTINNSILTNNAAMQVSAGTLNISPTTFTNSGALTATGGTLTLGGTWSNPGTITATNATVNLGGAFTTAGSFTRTGGTVNLTGDMNNTAAAFTFNAASGSWNLLAGTITGGTISFTGGNRLVATPSGGTLTDVQVNGELLADTTSARIRVAGSTRFTAARLSANGANFDMAPGYTLHDLIVAEGAAVGTRSIQGAVGGTGTLTISPTGVIRLAAGSGGGLSISNSNILTLINNGLISAEAAGRTLTINNSTLTNNGILQALDGTLSISPTDWANTASGILTATNAAISLTGAWSNAGTISINNATLNAGGTFTTAGFGSMNRTGGTVNLSGTMNNSGSTFTFNAGTGSWNFLGGEVLGGTVNFTGGNRLVPTTSGGLLTDVQVNGELLVDTTSARVRVAGATRFTAARLSANGANFDMAPGYTLHDLIVAEGATVGTRSIQGAVGGTGSLTISPTGVIRLAAGAGGNLAISNSNALTLINNGLITNEAAGRTLTINNSVFTNNGTVQALAGILSISPTTFTNYAKNVLTGGTFNAFGPGMIIMPAKTLILTNNATIGVGQASSFPAVANLSTNNGTLQTGGSGTDTITPAGGTLVNNGTLILAPTNVLNIAGNFTADTDSTTIIQIQGETASDIGRLTVTGTATLAGHATVVAVNGYDPSCVNSPFINAGNLVGQFDTQTLPTPSGDHQTFLVYIGDEARFAISPPSDFNRDGILNSQDVFDFLVEFFNGTPEGDFNGDGIINSQDFFDFLADFFEGCD